MSKATVRTAPKQTGVNRVVIKSTTHERLLAVVDITGQTIQGASDIAIRGWLEKQESKLGIRPKSTAA